MRDILIKPTLWRDADKVGTPKATQSQPLVRYPHRMDPLPAALATLLRPENIATALIAMNFAAFAAFGIDKARAERGAWRISEGALLNLAFFGGTVGAYSGRAVFRHKTRKQPFSGQLHAIAILQAAGLAGLVVWLH